MVMVAVRAGDVMSPTGRPLERHEVSALAVGGTQKIRSGELTVFLKVVAVAKASVRRDGRIQAQGSPCDHARLGVIEERLDRAAGPGPGAISEAARRFPLTGPVAGKRRRVLTAEFVLRAVILMTLMPHAGYADVMTALAGDLVLVPWAKAWRVPSPRVLSYWRKAAGPEPLEYLRGTVLRAAFNEHGGHDWRAVRVGDLHVRSADGTLLRVPDTPGNRAAFGSSGTSDDSAPYPQVRGLALNDVSTRSLFAMPYGASGGAKPDAEQKLLDTAMGDHPHLFTTDALWLFDRNFPGAPRVARLMEKTHVLIRVKSDLPLKLVSFLPDGSWLADLSGGEGKARVTVRVRVIEYEVTVAGQDVPEPFCLITDLTDCQAYPARMLAGAYRWRWDGSETGLREGKSALDGAGPSTGPMLRSRSPQLVRQELAAWVLAAELVRGLGRDAALIAAPARAGRRAGLPVHPRQLSFTAARRAVITSIRQGTATAELPRAAVTAATAAALAAIARTRHVTDRNRHRARKTKARQPFDKAGHRTPTRTAEAVLDICGQAA
jgi:hypothetical protein